MSAWPASTPVFDERDQVILDKRRTALDAVEGPRVGDWIRFADGMVWQISHLWDDSVQYTWGGSFYLGDGFVSYSGGLEPGVPPDTLTRTDEVKPGNVWFFHHDWHTAHNSVNASINFRVYESSVITHSYYCMRCSSMVPGTHRKEHSSY